MTARDFPLPALLRGDNLATEIRAAGPYLVPPGGVVALREGVMVNVERSDEAEMSEADWIAVGTAVAAHTGQLTPAQVTETEERRGRITEEWVTKLRAVRAGTATLTAAEVQRILATVALRMYREQASGP